MRLGYGRLRANIQRGNALFAELIGAGDGCRGGRVEGAGPAAEGFEVVDVVPRGPNRDSRQGCRLAVSMKSPTRRVRPAHWQNGRSTRHGNSAASRLPCRPTPVGRASAKTTRGEPSQVSETFGARQCFARPNLGCNSHNRRSVSGGFLESRRRASARPLPGSQT